ncbi:1-acyl-sn-glycerol-3-phosphate acyltransferase [Aurantiacibacter zhengii]|uniref:Acyltransferase n=1 Tax=Aurantiacibacter zhengii TaxID=2307003 RepID=A0A418NNY1_9SPHN|nr:1-acyl-sn-glycerol-3-phosphate acyltransferase [Aurantiacibacter zhengii]RIV83885.1 acyltransferase [Aurantiacibacter zhengii]
MTARSAPSLLSRFVWWVLFRLYRWKGFHLENHVPRLDKFILVGAPHTSNWDFIYFAGAVQEMGVKPRFIGKHTLFKWPMTRFMYDMGGMPINRSSPRGYVNAVVDQVNAAEQIALVIAPEGSRTSDGRWRSGFYHIASGAGVPIVPAWVNAETGQAGFGDPIYPSGDFHADLAKFAAFYQSVLPDCPRFEVLEEQARGAIATPARPVEPDMLAPEPVPTPDPSHD